MQEKETIQQKTPDDELTGVQRQFIAFALFSTGMRIGPSSFEKIEDIVKKLGIDEEFVDYAKGWIDFSQKKKEEKNAEEEK